jgi:hypothetical protein
MGRKLALIALAALAMGLAACATPCPPAPEQQASAEGAAQPVARCPFERHTNTAFAG